MNDTANKIQNSKRINDLITRVGVAISSLQDLHSELKEEYIRDIVFPDRTSEEDQIRALAFAKIGEKLEE